MSRRFVINLLSIVSLLFILFMSALTYVTLAHAKLHCVYPANEHYPIITRLIDNLFHSTWLYITGNILSSLLIMYCIVRLNQQLTKHINLEQRLLDSEKKLHYLAYYDPLTQLPNRAFLINFLDNLLSNIRHQGGNIAILRVNIDNFKNINDSLGYEAGDQFLVLFAHHLSTILRSTDLVARLGDDDFAIVIKEIASTKDIEFIARKILTSLSNPFVLNEHQLFLTASIGVSIYPNNGISTSALLKNADIALYQAKSMGKNNYQFCTPEMTIAVEEGALLDYQLHQAVLRHEFILLYQPKIALKTGKVAGVEVLMRWNRPHAGLVSPDQFISLAETNGLIIPISEWMIRAACLQAKKWQKQGLPPCTISINISIRQFSMSNFVDNVKKILSETGFDPAYLEIEITESILMKNSIDTITILRSLKDIGIKVTIDDFGTGYSSLSYLHAFALDKLKIDKSFINEITPTQRESSIINAIIVMAHSLGIKVVAEGVETATQLETLRRYHCDEVQGYFYSRPLPEDEILAFLNLS